MKWSKTKKAIEELLADSVKTHVQFHMTRYGPGLSFMMARAWITWDRQEVVNMSNADWLLETYALERQIRAVNGTTDFKDPAQRDGYYLAHVEAKAIIQQRGILSRFQFEESVEEYLGLSIETALQSGNPIIKAMAMFDGRVGKRRLAQLGPAATDHPLIRLFYTLRCKAEGMPITPAL
jgi:hypothetical protein